MWMIMYEISGYYDGDFRGLAESEEAFNRSDMQDAVHRMVSQGLCVEVVKRDSSYGYGNAERFRIFPDEYFDEFEGEFPYPEI
jgi:hypothetical protein